MTTYARLKERQLRTAAFLNDAGTLDVICDHVANGGSLIDLCKLNDTRYSEVMRWINSDDDRRKKYNDAIQARGEWFVQSILRELKLIGLADIREAYDEQGRLKPLKDMPEEIARVLSSVETDEIFDSEGAKVGQTRKIRMFDKLKSLEMLGRNLSMFIERVEHSGKVTLEDLLQKSRDGVAATHGDTKSPEIAGSNPAPASS